MNARVSRLFGKLTLIYVAVLVFNACLLEASNLWINRIPFHELLPFNIPFVFAGCMAIAGIMLLVTWYRLREVRDCLSEREPSIQQRQEAVYKLVKLPGETFWGLMGVALFFSILFHLISDIRGDYANEPLSDRILNQYLMGLLGEIPLGLTTAVLLYTFIRGAVRPYIIELWSQQMTAGEFRSSFIEGIMINFISGCLVLCLKVIQYLTVQAEMNAQTVRLDFTIIVLLYFSFAITIFVLTFWDYRKELRMMLERLRDLSAGVRSKMHEALPVISGDETGQLAAAFNQLQIKRAHDYAELDEQIKLAFRVQQNLLPARSQRFGPYTVAALSRPHQEVGGDLCDVIHLPGGRFALLIGDVSGKGLPSALLMTSVMMLFRSEVRKGGNAADVLGSVNRALCDRLQEGMYVTAGLAIIDTDKAEADYASAGHVSPYLLHRYDFTEIEYSSWPIGIDKEAVYNGRSIHLSKGDRLLFYTDGVVELLNRNGVPVGFEYLESLLGQLRAELPVNEQLKELLDFDQAQLQCEDDCTVLMIRYEGA